MTKELQAKIKALAVYQIIGGLIGLALTFFLLDLGRLTSFLWLILLPLIFGLYGYSIYCGFVLFKNLKRGLKHSKVNQFLQVVSFMAFGYAYEYTSGCFFSIGLNFTSFLDFNFNLGISSWKINVNSDNPTLELNLNLVAVFLIIFIDKAQQKLKNLDLEQQFSFEERSSLNEITEGTNG